MTTFYTFGARLSGMAAVVCAVLAVLAHPGQARADTMQLCATYCGDTNNAPDGFSACMGKCQGINACSGNDCSGGTSPCGQRPASDCTPGTCTATGKGVCSGCKCKDESADDSCDCTGF